MSHTDPLDEIGDLVGKTLDILGGADDGADPYASLSTATAPMPAAQQQVGTMQSLALDDDLDLLNSGAGRAPAAPDPLSGGGARAGPAYEDLVAPPQTASSVSPPAPSSQHPGRGDAASGTAAPSGGGALGGGLSPRPSAELPPLPAGAGIRVTIREPEKIETVNTLGIKTHYVQYTVRTDSSLPDFIAVGQEVKRRFSDFDGLHKHLKQEYRGYIVPPLPEKGFIQGKMAADDFIRLRRADLQAFVKSVAAHPVLRSSEAFKIFLIQPGELGRNPAWTYLVNPPQQLRQQRAGTSSSYSTSLGGASDDDGPVPALAKQLGSWMMWMKSSVAAFVPPKRELSEEEVALRQAKELLGDLSRLLELAVEAARHLCGHQEAVCGDVRELGRTFAMMSRFEEAVQSKVGQYTEQGTSAAARATDLNRMAYGAAKQHGLWKTLSLKTAASLVTLHDYYVLVPEAIAALDAREAALVHLQQLQDELAAKKHAQEGAAAAANKLRVLPAASTAPSPAEKRAYQLTTAIAQLEESIKAATAEYTELKARNQAELARLHLEREVDFRRMLSQFARTQAELVAASAEMWAGLARQYEGRPSGGGEAQTN